MRNSRETQDHGSLPRTLTTSECVSSRKWGTIQIVLFSRNREFTKNLFLATLGQNTGAFELEPLRLRNRSFDQESKPRTHKFSVAQQGEVG